MTFFKNRRKILLYVITAIFFSVCFFLIWDINHRFPNAKVEECNLNQSIKWNNLDFTPISRKVYTAQEYAVAYPEDSYDIDMKQGTMHVVFTIQVSNHTQQDIKLKNIMLMQAETSPFVMGNGISMVGDLVSVIKAGTEENVIEMSSVMSSNLVDSNYWSKERLESCEFHLVFTYYPVKKILNFG